MDEAAFHSLFETNFADVWRFARRRSASADHADEAVAETFAVAWRRRHDLPAADQTRMWLFGAARLVLANQHRTDRRREALQRRVEAFGATTPPAGDPAVVVANDCRDTLSAALDSLSADDRDLLVMRAWDELTVTEMAALLDCTANAVSIRLTRARGRLATALGQKDPRLSRTSPGNNPTADGDET